MLGAYSREAFGPDHNRYWYPRSWVAPNGQVFGISSEKMWYLDPAGTGSVNVAGDFKTGADATTRPNIGPTSTAVMFAPGRILQGGGNGYHDGHAMPASALATVIDISGAAPVLSEAAPMNFARHWGNATVLPDGRVVVTGGTAFGNNGGTDAVYAAELWNPATGSWTVGANAAQIRVYHSAAILLPNGTVLSTGGGAPGPVNNLNAEVYYPPYLFRSVEGVAQLAPRPAMTGISALQFAHGAALEIDMADAAGVSGLVLVGTSSMTHSFNTSQRHMPLAFTQNGQRLSATLPASAALAPPGYYQIVALDAEGVPSNGVIVGLGQGTSAPPVSALPRNQLVELGSLSQPGSVVASDAGGLGILKPLPAAPAAADLLSAQFILRDGLADSRCVSFESIAEPGRWLRHAAYRLQLGADDGSSLLRNDATFCPEPGLAGSGTSLRSKNFPARVLHHRNGQVWIDAETADAAFRADASFEIGAVALPVPEPVQAPLIGVGATASYTVSLPAPAAQYRWDFGDGSAATAYANTSAVTHTYASAGTYLVTLTLRLADGRSATKTFVQTVYAAAVAGTPRASSALLLEPRAEASARLWVVNGDNDSVSVFDTTGSTRLAEIAVGDGAGPRTLALAGNGRIWVVNKHAASISVIDPQALAVVHALGRPRASLTGLEKEQATHVQALLDLRRGRDRSQAYWDELIDGALALSVDPWYAPQAVSRCEAAWLRGADAQVRRIASAAFDAAAISGEQWRIGQLACWLQRVGGALPPITQDLPTPCRFELEGDARRAAQAWAALGCRYEQALALLGGSEGDLRQALALLDQLGAAPAARIARRRLRALGVRGVPRGQNSRTRDDALGLTAREREVLNLLALQLANRASAARLHRSERTVENHVAALLGKLGVASRADAAALARAHQK